MKNFKLFVALLTIITLISCKSSEDITAPDNLIGVISEDIVPKDLASAAVMNSVNSGLPNHYSKFIFDRNITGGETTFYGWCVDYDRKLYQSHLPKNVNIIASDSSNIFPLIIKYPYNFNKANWVINNRNGYSRESVQAALWTLLFDNSENASWRSAEDSLFSKSNYQELLSKAEGVEGWRPTDCGQKILVLVIEDSEDLSDPNLIQPVVIEVPVACDYIEIE